MTWGSVEHHQRVMVPVAEPDKRKRRMCSCGCRKKVTHRGTCNGLGMMQGCEMHVRRWVKDWQNAYLTADRVSKRKEGRSDE